MAELALDRHGEGEDPTPQWRGDEPYCCDVPMVHNSWTQQYECADAYFALVDEGLGEAVLLRVTVEDVGPELAKTLTHWRASRIPNTPPDNSEEHHHG